MREGWRRLRRLGLRRWLTLERDTLLQIAKTALAATVAWELSIVLLHTTLPALAALGAILTVQVTVKQTVTFGVQQVVGVTVGVGGALALVGVLGVHLWTVALLILAALVVGNLLRLGRQVNQVAISAVLVLALGTGYGSVRIIDTLLGATVGVLVNALLAPPTHVQAAAAEIARVAEDLGLLLADMGQGLGRGLDPKAPQDWLHRARRLDAARADAGEAVRRGDESLVYNPLGRGEAEVVARLTEAHRALEHVATQVRGIARTLADLHRHPTRPLAGRHGDATATPVLDALADPLEQTGAAVAAFGRLQVAGHREPAREELRRAHDAAAAGLEKVSAALTGLPPEQDARMLVSAYIDVGRVLHEIDPTAGAHTGAV